jgi:hypothetical protein
MKPPTTAWMLIIRFRQTGMMNDWPGKDRPCVMWQRQDRHLPLIHVRNRMITTEDTARRTPGLTNVWVSGQTFRSTLKWSETALVSHSSLNHTHHSLIIILTEPWHRRSCENSSFQNGKLFTFVDSTINERRWFKCLIRSSQTRSWDGKLTTKFFHYGTWIIPVNKRNDTKIFLIYMFMLKPKQLFIIIYVNFCVKRVYPHKAKNDILHTVCRYQVSHSSYLFVENESLALK